MRSSSLWLLPCAALLALTAYVVRVPALPARAEGSPAQRARIAEDVRRQEPRIRRRALEDFPGDLWSQGDDFANKERHLARQASARENLRVGAILSAIDADVRSAPEGGTRGGVAACMPRPFYD